MVERGRAWRNILEQPPMYEQPIVVPNAARITVRAWLPPSKLRALFSV
jgi:hypothetical protein